MTAHREASAAQREIVQGVQWSTVDRESRQALDRLRGSNCDHLLWAFDHTSNPPKMGWVIEKEGEGCMYDQIILGNDGKLYAGRYDTYSGRSNYSEMKPEDYGRSSDDIIKSIRNVGR